VSIQSSSLPRDRFGHASSARTAHRIGNTVRTTAATPRIRRRRTGRAWAVIQVTDRRPLYSVHVPTLGVVVPVYKGEPTLDELHRRLTAQLASLTDDWQIVYVDDGSPDGSWAILERLATSAGSRVRALRLIRNYGEHLAITAGLDAVDADHTYVMACDLQDDPAAMPALLDAARSTGADLVLTRRLKRQDAPLKRFLARLFYWLVQFFVKVRYDHRVGNYRLLSRRAVMLFREYRERTRNVNAIMAIMDVPTATIDVQHQPRGAGSSGYSIYRSARMAFHVLVGYSEVPLQLVVLLGVTISALAMLVLVWALAAPAHPDAAVQAIRVATSLLVLIAGLIILAIGTVGVYLTKSFVESMKRPLYFVADRRG
jgi:polyisoprenyl-phosphate glycosyltransferase